MECCGSCVVGISVLSFLFNNNNLYFLEYMETFADSTENNICFSGMNATKSQGNVGGILQCQESGYHELSDWSISRLKLINWNVSYLVKGMTELTEHLVASQVRFFHSKLISR